MNDERGKNHLLGKLVKEQNLKNKKEESLREVLGFFINKVDEKKFIRNKIRIMKEFSHGPSPLVDDDDTQV